MINVMNNGAVVLVDTDGAKPRTWRSSTSARATSRRRVQHHKTNVNKNDTFEDDPIDRRDLGDRRQGNIAKR